MTLNRKICIYNKKLLPFDNFCSNCGRMNEPNNWIGEDDTNLLTKLSLGEQKI